MMDTAVHEGERTGIEGPRDLHSCLESLRELLEGARSMPLSTAAIVNRDEALELLDEAVIRLPEELRQARWLLKEREEFLERARREADEIVEAARSRAEHMVQRTEVVKEAQRVARATVERAEAEGRQLRHQAEDYVDEKLAGFEVTLQRTMTAVSRGRKRLQAILPEAPVAILPQPPSVFDQDA
jgi:F0F1-type ATP synthase membrane subunit b/b'